MSTRSSASPQQPSHASAASGARRGLSSLGLMRGQAAPKQPPEVLPWPSAAKRTSAAIRGLTSDQDPPPCRFSEPCDRTLRDLPFSADACDTQIVKRSLLVTLLISVIVPASVSFGWASTGTAATSKQLNPISLSFSSSQSGYVLSLYDCASHTCANLRSTNDAGSSWTEVPIPVQLNKHLELDSWDAYGASYSTLKVHFADARDGWIYGTVPVPNAADPEYPNIVGRLWSTHDSGKTWRQIRLGPLHLTGGVTAMATHGPWTFLFGGTNTSAQSFILATHSNVDQWTVKSKGQMGMPAGGSQLEGAFSFAGSSGWFVAGNDRGFTASARLSEDGSWSNWSGPSVDDASFTPLGAVSKDVLVVEGQSAGFVIPPSSTVPRGWNRGASWLFISHDAGATFKPLRQLSRSYHGSYSTVPGLPATPIPGTILLLRTVGSSSQLVRSTNWGQSWQTVLKLSVDQVVFTSRSVGFAIAPQLLHPTTTTLLRTNDSGKHWNTSRFSI
jgi:hypothetical protein